MREQLKRLISAAAALCMLPGMAVLPHAGVTVCAESAAVTAAAASAVSYRQSEAFASLVRSIEEGACGLYLDSKEWTEPEEPLAVGTRMNRSQRYYVKTSSGQWNGMQCYIYSQGVYSRLFDALPLNGTADTLMTRIVMQGPAEITPQTLYEARVMPGAYLRTTPDTETGKFNGGAGHSLIVLGYDDSTITILEGNADGNGLIREATMSYEEFAHQFTTGWNRTVTHIIQPDASVYQQRFGMTYSYVPAVTAPAETEATAPAPAAVTTYTAATAAAVITTTAAATTAAPVTTVTTTAAAPVTVTTTTAAQAPVLAAVPFVQPLSSGIEQMLESMPVSYTADTIRVTRKSMQIALFLPESKSYAWASSNPDVVQVDESGRVTVRSNGRAVITAVRGQIRCEFPIDVQMIGWTELGDINLDGTVDPADASLALSIYVESLVQTGSAAKFSALQLSRADVDDNGTVSVEDAQNILRYYVEYTLSGSGRSTVETWSRLLGLE